MLPQIKNPSFTHLPELGRLDLNSSCLHNQKNPFEINPNLNIFELKLANKEIRLARIKEAHTKGIIEKSKTTIPTNLMEIKNQFHDVKAMNYKQDTDGKDILEAADEIIRNKFIKHENIKKFVDKKRDMFLIQMKIDQKKEQIKFFEETTLLKESKMKEVEAKIKSDFDNFNNFLEENKLLTREMLKEAEKESIDKIGIINKLKKLNEIKSAKITSNSKLLEKVEELYIYKKFLDDFTMKRSLTDTKSSKLDDKGASEERDHNNFTPFMKYYNTNSRFSEEIKSLLCQEESPQDFYFKDPDQMKNIFKEIEEENLTLIRTTQKLKEKYDDLKSDFEEKKLEFDLKKDSIVKICSQLKTNIKEKRDELKRNSVYFNANVKQINDTQTTINNKIFEVCGDLGIDHDSSSVKALSKLEKLLLGYIENANLINDERFKKFEKNFIGDNRKMGLNDADKTRKEVLETNIIDKIYKRPLKVRRPLPKSHLISKKKTIQTEKTAFRDDDKYFN